MKHFLLGVATGSLCLSLGSAAVVSAWRIGYESGRRAQTTDCAECRRQNIAHDGPWETISLDELPREMVGDIEENQREFMDGIVATLSGESK